MHLVLCALFIYISNLAVGICSKNEFIYLLQGRTGAGKSSLVNMMNNGDEIAKEGATYHSETLETTMYNTSYSNVKLIDTPGLFETRGYSNEEINALIRSTLIKQSIYSVSGILLIFNPIQPKIHLQTMVESILSMFGSIALENVFITFNKNDKINEDERENLMNGSIEILFPIYKNYNLNYDSVQIKKRILFLDTKGDINLYSDKLTNIITNTNGKIEILSDEQIRSDIDKYYQIELKDENNYKYTSHEIQHSEKRKRTVKKPKVESYTERCNCRKKKKRFLGITVKKKTVCDTCSRPRTVMVDVEEEYIYNWVETKKVKTMKYSEEYLWEKAKTKMINEMKNKVYNALQARQQNKNEL